MANEVATIQQYSAPANYRQQIETIKQTVAKGATDSQLEMFLTLAERYSLDPFLREIWFVPNVGIITGRDGYLKVAQRDPDYDGITSAAVCEGDKFELEPIIPNVKHRFGAKRGAVIGAYAVVFHKKRRPAVCYAPMSEYRKSSSVWTTYQSAMICKVAEVLALKRQFGISGLVTEEEMGSGQPTPHTLNDAKTAQQAVLAQKRSATNPQGSKSAVDLNALNATQLLAHIKNAKEELVHEFNDAGEARYQNVLSQFNVVAPKDIKSLAKARQILEALTAAKADLQMNGVDVIDVTPEEAEAINESEQEALLANG